jgi:hypothetical protein
MVSRKEQNFLTSWTTITYSRRALCHGVGYIPMFPQLAWPCITLTYKDTVDLQKLKIKIKNLKNVNLKNSYFLKN